MKRHRFPVAVLEIPTTSTRQKYRAPSVSGMPSAMLGTVTSPSISGDPGIAAATAAESLPK